ncbi:SphA family protein [Aureimonas leprariae]|nr:transporter [Aureimonas leprariae]
MVAALTVAGSGHANATEAVAGRYIPGAFAIPGAGIVPPPGLYWNAATSFYHGTLGADVQVPVAGEIRAGLEATILAETFTGLWVPNVEIAPGTSLALTLSVPVQYLDAEASVGRFDVEADQVALGDIAFGPRLGWHSGPHFFSLGLNVFAPTGKWEEGALDNIGLNYWSFSPTVAYTYLDVPHGLDLSLNAGIDINTKDRDTDYYSGALAHLDAVAMKTFTERFSAGIFGSVLYQVESDEGGIADRLGGFKGRSYSVGPMVKFDFGPKEKPIAVSLSWAPEFGVENRTEGNAVYLSVAGKF